ncbi:hypothetical protein [Amycolatopsis kentuckyensis]
MNHLHVSDEFDAVLARLDAIAPVIEETAEQGEALGAYPTRPRRP